jgi:hypothetical protein
MKDQIPRPEGCDPDVYSVVCLAGELANKLQTVTNTSRMNTIMSYMTSATSSLQLYFGYRTSDNSDFEPDVLSDPEANIPIPILTRSVITKPSQPFPERIPLSYRARSPTPLKSKKFVIRHAFRVASIEQFVVFKKKYHKTFNQPVIMPKGTNTCKPIETFGRDYFN